MNGHRSGQLHKCQLKSCIFVHPKDDRRTGPKCLKSTKIVSLEFLMLFFGSFKTMIHFRNIFKHYILCLKTVVNDSWQFHKMSRSLLIADLVQSLQWIDYYLSVSSPFLFPMLRHTSHTSSHLVTVCFERGATEEVQLKWK